jgi:hypothetical protein
VRGRTSLVKLTKQLTTGDLYREIVRLDNDLPVVIVGERQEAVSAQVAYQTEFDPETGETKLRPVTLLIQLIPVK